MLKAVLISILGLSLVACGGSESEDDSSPKNADLEPNSSLDQAQQLIVTTQSNQADLQEQVISVHFDGSLNFSTDSSDFYSVGVINRPGDYVVSAGWHSNLIDPIGEFELQIFKNGSLYKTLESDQGEQSDAIWCLEVEQGEELSFGLNTEGDSGSYGFGFYFFSNIGLSCDSYNGNPQPEDGSDSNGDLTYVYKLNALGDGVCGQDAHTDSALAEGTVNNLGYSYGKCEEVLGTDTFAYCQVSNDVTAESRYYFSNTMTTADAQFKCSGWSGQFQTLGVSNPSDIAGPYFSHDVDGLGAGICVEYEHADQASMESTVNGLGYTIGKCTDSINISGYCQLTPQNSSYVQHINYFDNSMSQEDGMFYCNGWNGTYVAAAL